jgi:hypothetical protein
MNTAPRKEPDVLKSIMLQKNQPDNPIPWIANPSKADRITVLKVLISRYY